MHNCQLPKTIHRQPKYKIGKEVKYRLRETEREREVHTHALTPLQTDTEREKLRERTGVRDRAMEGVRVRESK